MPNKTPKNCLNKEIIASNNFAPPETKFFDGQIDLQFFTNLADGKLTIDDTNKLLKYLNKEHISEESMCLADIYNIDTEVYKTETKENKIGF